jgi:hypothetical protein
MKEKQPDLIVDFSDFMRFLSLADYCPKFSQENPHRFNVPVENWNGPCSVFGHVRHVSPPC